MTTTPEKSWDLGRKIAGLEGVANRTISQTVDQLIAIDIETGIGTPNGHTLLVTVKEVTIMHWESGTNVAHIFGPHIGLLLGCK